MPYITQDLRSCVDTQVNDLIEHVKGCTNEHNKEGVVNYAFTRVLTELYGTNYHDINAVMGVLACVQAEYYRRLAAPYENQKAMENSDVFPNPIQS